MDDFDRVTFRKEVRGVLRADHDLLIYLHGDRPSGERQMLHEPTHREPFGDVARLTVYRHPHRGIIC